VYGGIIERKLVEGGGGGRRIDDKFDEGMLWKPRKECRREGGGWDRI
jgi:hypothetical protein